jgi:hypothetical protein
MEEAIELVYRIQVNHGGSLSESKAYGFGPWVERPPGRRRFNGGLLFLL